MDQKVNKEQIEKIGKLSNLTLSENEVMSYSKIFTDILSYINVLHELDLQDLEPTFQVTGTTNVFMTGRENQVTLSQKEALSNADETKKGLFATEGVFDRE